VKFGERNFGTKHSPESIKGSRAPFLVTVFFLEKFYGARRFYEPLRDSDPIVKKTEEHDAKN